MQKLIIFTLFLFSAYGIAVLVSSNQYIKLRDVKALSQIQKHKQSTIKLYCSVLEGPECRILSCDDCPSKIDSTSLKSFLDQQPRMDLYPKTEKTLAKSIVDSIGTKYIDHYYKNSILIKCPVNYHFKWSCSYSSKDAWKNLYFDLF